MDTVNNRAVAVRQIASLEEADQQDCRRDQDDVRHIRFHGVQERRGQDQQRVQQKRAEINPLLKRISGACLTVHLPFRSEYHPHGIVSTHAGPPFDVMRNTRTGAPVLTSDL